MIILLKNSPLLNKADTCFANSRLFWSLENSHQSRIENASMLRSPARHVRGEAARFCFSRNFVCSPGRNLPLDSRHPAVERKLIDAILRACEWNKTARPHGAPRAISRLSIPIRDAHGKCIRPSEANTVWFNRANCALQLPDQISRSTRSSPQLRKLPYPF